jgi:hypothetical protein
MPPQSSQNCEFRATVDLGDGPIVVRCTKVGQHDRHQTVIDLGLGERDAPMRHNIFEEDGG